MYDRRKHPTLRRGARGDAVVRMQKRLFHHNSGLDEAMFVDGDFGPNTEREVKRFQKTAQLKVDGVVGQETWRALLRQKGEKVASPVGKTAATDDRKQAAAEQSPRGGGGMTIDRIKRALERKGYVFLDDGKPYQLNIIGIRNPSTAVNSFDDKIALIYRDDTGKLQIIESAITTDPGEYFTKTKLLNKAGAAILVPGQYRDAYKIAKHRSKYDALCQRGGAVTVWRDGNRDDKLDRSGKTYTGWYGINIHRAGQSGTTEKIGRYSAGCQVFQNADEFGVFMKLAKKHKDRRSNKFTYTLLDESDLK